jgi:hypothetical protein
MLKIVVVHPRGPEASRVGAADGRVETPLPQECGDGVGVLETEVGREEGEECCVVQEEGEGFHRSPAC